MQRVWKERVESGRECQKFEQGTPPDNELQIVELERRLVGARQPRSIVDEQMILPFAETYKVGRRAAITLGNAMI